MSLLATRAEIIKLAGVLDCDTQTLGYLAGVPAEELRRLREAVYEHLFKHDHKLFSRLAALGRWLPAWVVVILAKLFSMPLLTARMAGEMPARRVAYIGTRAPPAYLADVAAWLDPRIARDAVRFVPVESVLKIAMETLARRDFVTMGRFMDIMPDASLAPALQGIDDDDALLRICFYIESRNRLDHVLRLLPRERLQNLLQRLESQDAEIECAVMSLLIHAGHALRREMFDFLTADDEGLLDRLIEVTHREALWEDLLPALRGLSGQCLHTLVNRPALRRDPAILKEILDTANRNSLWTSLVPLFQHMDVETRSAAAQLGGEQPEGSLQGMATAALMSEQWPAMLDLVSQMPENKLGEMAAIAQRYGEVDPGLYQRLSAAAAERGMRFVTT